MEPSNRDRVAELKLMVRYASMKLAEDKASAEFAERQKRREDMSDFTGRTVAWAEMIVRCERRIRELREEQKLGERN